MLTSILPLAKNAFVFIRDNILPIFLVIAVAYCLWLVKQNSDLKLTNKSQELAITTQSETIASLTGDISKIKTINSDLSKTRAELSKQKEVAKTIISTQLKTDTSGDLLRKRLRCIELSTGSTLKKDEITNEFCPQYFN